MTTKLKNELASIAREFKDKPNKKLSKSKAVWIFGAGQFGQDLHAALKSEGYCVARFIESNPTEKSISGIKAINWEEWSTAHKNEPVCKGVFNRNMPLDQLRLLAQHHGACDLFLPWDLYPLFKTQLGWRFWLSDPELITNHLDDLAKVIDLLSDECSKRCLIDIVKFRLGLNLSYASFQHSENQYFNKLTLISKRDKPFCFVDGGAYTGDTFLELSNLINVNEAYLFEPDRDNFLKLVLNTRNRKQRVNCLPLGLSDCYGMLNFSAGNGEGASIQEAGTAHIAVVDLDSLMAGETKVDFLKLDVEGAELKALHGATQLISNSRPVLAISLYHRPQDLWELPLFLSSICADYQFYIRQHFSNSFECVVYAIPKELTQ